MAVEPGEWKNLFEESTSDVLILFLIDYKFIKCGSAMKISGPDCLTVTLQRSGYNLATGNVVVGEEGGLTRAYFELRIDSGSSSRSEEHTSELQSRE